MGRRVLVALDESDVGRNALWWAVEYARRREAPLFVVVLWPTSLPTVPLRMPPAPHARSSSPVQDAVAVGDALLLAVGEPPPDVRILVASVTGRAPAGLLRLADRAGDLVVLSRPPRRAAVARCHRGGRVEMLVVPDATGEPVHPGALVS